MLSLMLNPRFKGFRHVSSYIGHEHKVFIMEKYDVKTLYGMFLKCYPYLHPVGESESSGFIDHKDEDNKLNIFQMTTSSNKLAKKLVTKELLNFRRFHVNVKDIKSLLLWWEKHHFRFLVVGLLVRKYLAL